MKETHEHPVLAIHNAMCQFYRLRQGKTQTVQEYLETFQSMVEVLDSLGADNATHDAIVNHQLAREKTTMDEASDEQIKEATEQGREMYLAVCFLVGSDKRRFGGLIVKLQNDYLLGADNYPKTVMECFALLNHWSQYSKYTPRRNNTNTGVAFSNYRTTGSRDGCQHRHSKKSAGALMCARCGRRSHRVDMCHAKRHLDGTILLAVGSVEASECDLVY